MKQNLWKKLTSAALSVVLALGLCPALAFAGTADLQAGGGAFLNAQATTVDNSTVLPDKEYSLVNTEIYKSDKLTLTSEKILVSNGKATAEITTSSDNSQKIFAGTAEEAAAASESEYVAFAEKKATIPIRIGEANPVSIYTSAMGGRWTAYSLTFEIKEATVPLSIYDEEAMFKVVNANLKVENGLPYFVFCLSAKGYEDVISGTYDEAIAIGKDKNKWIHYTTENVVSSYEMSDGIHNEAAEDKYQFAVPIVGDEAISAAKAFSGSFRIPIVAVSKSRYTAAESANPENPDYSLAFTARQAVIDLSKKHVRIGNYQDTYAAKVTSSLTTMPVAAEGEIYTVGTAQMNEFTVQPTFKVTGDTYDKAFVGTAADAAKAADSALVTAANDGQFVIPLYNSRDKKRTDIDVKTWQASVAFHVKSGAPYAEANTWVQRTLTVNPEKTTIAISGSELSAPKKEEAKKEEAKTTETSTEEPAATGIAKGTSATTGSGATAAKVKATSSTAVEYVAPKSKKTKTVKVPDTVTVNGKKYKVTSVAASAFKGSKATSITIGKNVTTLGKGALSNTKKLTKLTLGKNLKKVGKNALKGSKVKKLTLKSSKLTKASMKNLLKGSKVKTIKTSGVSKKMKKDYKKWAKKYNVTVK